MRKILAIDDEPEIREVIEQFFKSREMDVVTLANGSNAVERIIQYEPDVIILDINLKLLFMLVLYLLNMKLYLRV